MAETVYEMRGGEETLMRGFAIRDEVRVGRAAGQGAEIAECM